MVNGSLEFRDENEDNIDVFFHRYYLCAMACPVRLWCFTSFKVNRKQHDIVESSNSPVVFPSHSRFEKVC